MDSWRKAGLWEIVCSAWAWAASGWFILTMGPLLMFLQLFIRPDRLDVLNRFGARVLVRISWLRWRAVVHPDVDPGRPYVFCQNHVNHFDFVVLYRATAHFKQGLELEDHFSWPVYGWFMKQRGTIPVKSGKKGQTDDIKKHFTSEIGKGHSILAFPEGMRTRDRRVGPFKTGVFFIARDLGIPVVPVAVTGMQDVMRADSWLIRTGREVTVYCEKPIETAGLTDEEVVEMVQRVREPIVRRVDDYLAKG